MRFRLSIWRKLLVAIALQAIVAFQCGNAAAQGLAPRAYWPTPNGTDVLVVGYQHSTGDIVIDASLPITGVDSEIDFLQLSYQRTFSLSGRTATVQLNVPFADGSTEGFVDGEPRQRDTTGIGDASMRFAINLKGAPTMDGAAFQKLRANPETIVGASLVIVAPTGDYEKDKLLNVGTNRWSVKPAVGAIWPLNPRLLLEFELGVWFFGDNDDFLGETRKQDPVMTAEVHLVKRIRPGFWASLDGNYYAGGRTDIEGISQANLQRNSRFGATVVFPINGRHAVRGSFSTGLVTKSGGDYDIVSLSYLYAW
jgi:hypothetical protein